MNQNSFYDEVLDFNDLDNQTAILELANSLPDTGLAYTQLFTLACRNKKIEAAKFIYHHCQDNHIALEIKDGLMIAVNNEGAKIIQYFISLNEDMKFNDNALLQRALTNNVPQVVIDLMDYCEYSREILKNIFEVALSYGSYKIIKAMEKKEPAIVDINMDTINSSIKNIIENIENQSYFIYVTEDNVDFIIYMIDKGGNKELLNNSAVILSLIYDERHKELEQFFNRGIYIDEINFINHIQDDFIHKLINWEDDETEEDLQTKIKNAHEHFQKVK